ncbi:MAG TPA: sigma-70 family RNA polymerase sigma factor [Polyangiales bacterium]|nr:sigma-70 family RNA polymerase sigma factor [Polyangiales bacterium]
MARSAQQGDEGAFDRLVRAHVRLVFAMAGEYRSFGAPMADLVGEGLLALVAAARRYDPERGVRLAPYAAHWIKARLRHFTLRTRRIVGPPATRKSRMVVANLTRAKRELSHVLGAEPDREALADYLAVSAQQIADVELALYTHDAAVASEGSFERDGVHLASPEPSPESIFAQAEQSRETHGALQRGLATLSARERAIVEARHLQSEPPTLDHIGRNLQVSRERVRQLEARGYRKLCAAVLDSVA